MPPNNSYGYPQPPQEGAHPVSAGVGFGMPPNNSYGYPQPPQESAHPVSAVESCSSQGDESDDDDVISISQEIPSTMSTSHPLPSIASTSHSIPSIASAVLWSNIM